MMIPVAGQYEQACNALDAVESGAGIASKDFDFGKLENVQKKDAEASWEYQNWVNSWPLIFREITIGNLVHRSNDLETFHPHATPVLD